MLHQPTPSCLSLKARRAYNRALWHDSTILHDTGMAYANAYRNGQNAQLAYDIADLRSLLSLKVDVQSTHPTPARAAQICALAEELAALETEAKLDTAPALAR